MLNHDGQTYLADHHDTIHIQARLLAHRHFERARRQSVFRALWYWLRGRSCQLLRLGDVSFQMPPQNSVAEEIEEIDLRRITGSEGRADDFDCAFAPLREQDRERWVTLAALILEGRELPPIELVQINTDYYVCDGHHRVSVARTLGERTISAYVHRAVVSEWVVDAEELSAVSHAVVQA